MHQDQLPLVWLCDNIVTPLPGLVQKDHVNLQLAHLCFQSSFCDIDIPYIRYYENSLGFSFFNTLRGLCFLWGFFLVFLFFWECACVHCFADGCKLPSQSSSSHSPHALEGTLDSRQHILQGLPVTRWGSSHIIKQLQTDTRVSNQ